MIILFLTLSLFPLLVKPSFDEDLIIERHPHHVDWEDMFMEYNRYSAPNRARQEVNLTIEVLSIKDHKILFELNQNWRDERLRFVGVSRVPVPSHIQPWTPDTYIRNGWDVVMEQKSLDLHYDGTFLLRCKYQAKVDFDENSKETIIVISSFNNYGTERINYNLRDSQVALSSHTHISSKQVSRKFDSLRFDDLQITIHSNPVTDIISNNSTF